MTEKENTHQREPMSVKEAASIVEQMSSSCPVLPHIQAKTVLAERMKRARNQDLRLALPVIIEQADKGFTPDELHKIGVKDTGSLARNIRAILEAKGLPVELQNVGDREAKATPGRKPTRYIFVRSRDETRQLPLID